MFEIRKTKEVDLQELVELSNIIWDENTTPVRINFDSIEEYAKKNPPGSEYVAILDNRVAGYIKFKVNPYNIPATNHIMEISIGVHPSYQGKKIGSKLMDFIYNQAKELGIRKISLKVLSTNEKAISFYIANGYKEQGRLKEEFFLNNKYVDDVYMYKTIIG